LRAANIQKEREIAEKSENPTVQEDVSREGIATLAECRE
jgi:hypothetical protein